MEWRRLDLAEIAAALAALELAEATANISHALREEPLTADALRRLLAGYRYVDDLLGTRTDIFRYGETRHILELNHLVLCGTSPERRQQFAKHIRETENRFYDLPGIGDFMEWYKRNQNRPPRTLAGGAFLRVLSAPQLFIEGNSRTAVLLVSYILARAGIAPLVVTQDSFRDYIGMVERCIDIDRTGFSSLFSGASAIKKLTQFLAQACDARFLAGTPAHDAAEFGQSSVP